MTKSVDNITKIEKQINSMMVVINQIGRIVDENISKTMIMNHYLVHLIYLLDKDKIIDKTQLEDLANKSIDEFKKEIEIVKNEFKSKIAFSSIIGEA